MAGRETRARGRLTQTTFTKLYRAWRRIERHDSLDQYTRRVLVRAFLDERRRPWRRRVITVDGTPIRVSTGTRPDVGEVMIATRVLAGGFLAVITQQGTPVYEPDTDNPPPDARHRPSSVHHDHRPPLATSPLTAEQLAALAANPAMLS